MLEKSSLSKKSSEGDLFHIIKHNFCNILSKLEKCNIVSSTIALSQKNDPGGLAC